MSLNLLRNPSLVNNILLETMRKRAGLSFRKTLGVYNYKVKPAEYYKNPHQVPLRLKESLMKKKNEYATRKLNWIKRNSVRPFGSFTTKGLFVRDLRRVPVFNIPNVDDFYLKPYVAWKSIKIDPKTVKVYSTMNADLLNKIKIQMKRSSSKNIRLLAYEIFETKQGKKIVEEYLNRNSKRTKLKVVNF